MSFPDPKPLVKRLLAHTGFQVIRASTMETFDRHLLRMLTALAINCVLDVGACDGDFGRELRRIGYRGHLLSFEPVARNYERLSLAARGDQRWRVFPFALGERSGQAEINVFRGNTFHSLLAPSDFGQARFGEKLDIERTERIEIRRLDEVLDSSLNGIQEPRLYLKMDTQGYDLAVVEGAGAAFGRVLGLQTEVALQPIYRDMRTTLCGTLPQLQERGFGVTGFFPVERDKDGFQVIEFDCVMIRRGAVAVPSAPSNGRALRDA